MRSASGGFDQRQAFKQLQTAASAPEATLAGLAPAHMCTRFCQFQHQFGNLFRCVTSGTQHVCDQTCQQTVQVRAAATDTAASLQQTLLRSLPDLVPPGSRNLYLASCVFWRHA